MPSTYGICHLSLVAVRTTADHGSEMYTQLLYGDSFKLLEKRKAWSRIRVTADGSEGWVENCQFVTLTDDAFNSLQADGPRKRCADLVAYAILQDQGLLPVLLGSTLNHCDMLSHSFEGTVTRGSHEKAKLIDTALLFLHAPYLRGGKSPFGIDCGGLAQMVYQLNGFSLDRHAAEQAKQGQALSFIEESEAGDLAFFDNSDGLIDHVGLIMRDNYIIHVNGKVRIDRLDHTGIFNTELKTYSHSLRVIKKII